MKILVVHDEKGNIKSIGVPTGPPGQEMQLRPEAGLEVTEVEASHIKDQNDHEQLRAIAKNFKVDTDSRTLLAR
ncbi:MAG: hypothetical protein WA709_29465 [Stellaceae bacterium]|jgi:hypothetical protein